MADRLQQFQQEPQPCRTVDTSIVIAALRQQLLQREEENHQLQEEVQIAKNMFETVSLQLDQMTEEAGKNNHSNHLDGNNHNGGGEEDEGKEEMEKMKKSMQELEVRNAELESQAQLSFLRTTALE